MLGGADTEHYAWVLPIYTSLSVKVEKHNNKDIQVIYSLYKY